MAESGDSIVPAAESSSSSESVPCSGSMIDTAIKVAAEKMQLHPLKPKQLEAARIFMSGRDVFVSLPTGYGKSAIYALLPLAFDHLLGRQGSIAVIVSPLTSLMIDQRQRFTPIGVSVEFVGEAQQSEEICMNVINGAVQLVYISPESLLNNKRYRHMFQGQAYQKNMIAFVIDEAHCVKTWGDNFRVAFSKLGTLRSLLSNDVHVMALTATATSETLKCVKDRVSMNDVVLIGMQPDRPNIKYIVRPSIKVDELSTLLATELIEFRAKAQKTVIFCRTLAQCANLLISLKQSLGTNITEPPGMPVTNIQYRLFDIFTAGSTTEMREMILQEFCKLETHLRFIIATSAFGLGIDCPNITRIIHWGPPNTLEELAQETGRAGRDGSISEAILYYGKPGKHVSKSIKDYGKNKSVCRRVMIFQDFLFANTADITQAHCHCCDICAASCTCIACTSS